MTNLRRQSLCLWQNYVTAISCTNSNQIGVTGHTDKVIPKNLKKNSHSHIWGLAAVIYLHNMQPTESATLEKLSFNLYLHLWFICRGNLGIMACLDSVNDC